jgi:FMN phosphatase YigB (HAD superfamily)
MIDFTKIKNIIFDLGGVLYDIDYHKTIKAFENIGINNFEMLYSQAKQSNLFDQFEKGLITNQQFRTAIKAIIGQQITDNKIDLAWNAMLLSMPPIKIELLQRLNPYFNLFLLSNTNGIHLPMVKEHILNIHNTELPLYFKKCYFSNEIHQRKPDASCFNWVLTTNNLLPNETLFLDDTIQHINGANAVGIQTILITDINHTEKIFESYLNTKNV